MREKGTDKYENAHVQAVAMEFSRRREREPFALRTFVRLFVLNSKKADNGSVEIQPVLRVKRTFVV